MLDIVQIPVLNDNYIYLVHEPSSNTTAVIDPALSEPVLDEANRRGWKITHIFNTHHHGDHVGGNMEIQSHTNCEIVGNRNDQARIPGLTRGVEEAEIVALGSVEFRIMDVPGHTVGHIAYYAAAADVLFCGDTVFAMGCGRLFEGTPAQMWDSIQKIITLPPETQLYCGHEYTEANGKFALTIEPKNADLIARVNEVKHVRRDNMPTIPTQLGVEIKTNPFLRAELPSLASEMGTKSGQETFARIRHLKDIF